MHVVGTVQGSMEGENAFGGTVTAVAIEASKVEVVTGPEAVDPAQKTIEVGQTLTDQGFSVTLEKIEFGEDTTRVYLSAYNGTSVGAAFYEFDAKIIQGSTQLDQETTFDYEVKAPQSELNPGVRTDGVITFGKADPSQPLEVRFEWSSDDCNVTPNPIVFEVATGNEVATSEEQAPEAVLAAQYEYINSEDYESAYALFAEQSQQLVSLEQYSAFFEANAPYSITDYSFPSVEVEGETATVDVVFTASSAEGEEQFYRTQQLVREDGGWRVVMREDQVAAFLGTG